MVTIKDVAKRANVSITTVSRVINNKSDGVGEETRQRVLQAMAELDYQPNRIARGLVTKKTYTLGLILPDITNPFFPEIARGVEDTANRYGYNIILCDTDDCSEKEQLYINVLQSKYVDGIIFTSSTTPTSKHVGQLVDRGIPLVLLDRYVNGKELPGVYADNFDGMYQITRYVLEMGHKSIAYIGGPHRSLNSAYRFKGFEQALSDFGLRVSRDLVEEGNYKINGGKEGMEKLLSKGRHFTAVVCANDLTAVGAMEELKERGYRVPEDMSVTGFDGIQISGFVEPKLTTVAQPCYEMGSTATEMLIKLIEGQSVDQMAVTLKPRLIIRNSVKKVTP